MLQNITVKAFELKIETISENDNGYTVKGTFDQTIAGALKTQRFEAHLTLDGKLSKLILNGNQLITA